MAKEVVGSKLGDLELRQQWNGYTCSYIHCFPILFYLLLVVAIMQVNMLQGLQCLRPLLNLDLPGIASWRTPWGDDISNWMTP